MSPNPDSWGLCLCLYLVFCWAQNGAAPAQVSGFRNRRAEVPTHRKPLGPESVKAA